MTDVLHDFVMTFVPLFIVINAFGNLFFMITVGEGNAKHEHRKMVHFAIVTVTAVGLIFLFFGQFILKIMNISAGSFAIAGGIMLPELSSG